MRDIDIDKIASLARLRPDQKERGKLLHDIEQIIDYIENISSIDTSGMTPMRHPPWQFVGLREDVASAKGDPELFQQSAPESGEGYYLVPRVVE
ncbi:MAG: Asp-tRNA(Asn)/Glu-tRNA(Gln) amidotransferase subunit GatC [Candidatus Porifericomitaceae bacterium WSBS_2022_MAG_OTU9]